MAQTHSFVAQVQVDFTFDDDRKNFMDAIMEALHLAVRPSFHTISSGVSIERVVVSDNEGAGMLYETEAE